MARPEYDKGDILFQSSTQVTYPITIAQLIAKVADNYVDAGLQVLSRLDIESLQTDDAGQQAST